MSRSRARGFTLTELAVVVAIVGLLLSTLLYTLSAQTEQRNFEETRRRLEAARELLLAYAIVNGRLPCPATAASAGDEDLAGGNCVTNFGGWLPARTIGFQIVDAAGYAIDAWGNRIRYAVANAITGCSGSSTTPHFISAATLRANGISCQPNDLRVCKSATNITATSCGALPANAANYLTNQTTVVALVLSTGKNGALGSAGADEAANVDGADGTFVFHTPTPVGAANGEFDDYLVWITVGELYGRLIAAGVLP